MPTDLNPEPKSRSKKKAQKVDVNSNESSSRKQTNWVHPDNSAISNASAEYNSIKEEDKSASQLLVNESRHLEKEITAAISNWNLFSSSLLSGPEQFPALTASSVNGYSSANPISLTSSEVVYIKRVLVKFDKKFVESHDPGQADYISSRRQARNKMIIETARNIHLYQDQLPEPTSNEILLATDSEMDRHIAIVKALPSDKKKLLKKKMKEWETEFSNSIDSNNADFEKLRSEDMRLKLFDTVKLINEEEGTNKTPSGPEHTSRKASTRLTNSDNKDSMTSAVTSLSQEQKGKLVQVMLEFDADYKSKHNPNEPGYAAKKNEVRKALMAKTVQQLLNGVDERSIDNSNEVDVRNEKELTENNKSPADRSSINASDDFQNQSSVPPDVENEDRSGASAYDEVNISQNTEAREDLKDNSIETRAAQQYNSGTDQHSIEVIDVTNKEQFNGKLLLSDQLISKQNLSVSETKDSASPIEWSDASNRNEQRNTVKRVVVPETADKIVSHGDKSSVAISTELIMPEVRLAVDNALGVIERIKVEEKARRRTVAMKIEADQKMSYVEKKAISDKLEDERKLHQIALDVQAQEIVHKMERQLEEAVLKSEMKAQNIVAELNANATAERNQLILKAEQLDSENKQIIADLESQMKELTEKLSVSLQEKSVVDSKVKELNLYIQTRQIEEQNQRLEQERKESGWIQKDKEFRFQLQQYTEELKLERAGKVAAEKETADIMQELKVRDALDKAQREKTQKLEDELKITKDAHELQLQKLAEQVRQSEEMKVNAEKEANRLAIELRDRQSTEEMQKRMHQSEIDKMRVEREMVEMRLRYEFQSAMDHVKASDDARSSAENRAAEMTRRVRLSEEARFAVERENIEMVDRIRRTDEARSVSEQKLVDIMENLDYLYRSKEPVINDHHLNYESAYNHAESNILRRTFEPASRNYADHISPLKGRNYHSFNDIDAMPDAPAPKLPTKDGISIGKSNLMRPNLSEIQHRRVISEVDNNDYSNHIGISEPLYSSVLHAPASTMTQDRAGEPFPSWKLRGHMPQLNSNTSESRKFDHGGGVSSKDLVKGQVFAPSAVNKGRAAFKKGRSLVEMSYNDDNSSYVYQPDSLISSTNMPINNETIQQPLVALRKRDDFVPSQSNRALKSFEEPRSELSIPETYSPSAFRYNSAPPLQQYFDSRNEHRAGQLDATYSYDHNVPRNYNAIPPAGVQSNNSLKNKKLAQYDNDIAIRMQPIIEENGTSHNENRVIKHLTMRGNQVPGESETENRVRSHLATLSSHKGLANDRESKTCAVAESTPPVNFASMHGINTSPSKTRPITDITYDTPRMASKNAVNGDSEIASFVNFYSSKESRRAGKMMVNH